MRGPRSYEGLCHADSIVVLQDILGILERTEHPVAVHLQLAAVRLGQFAERFAVAGLRLDQQVACHPSTLASRLTLLGHLKY